MTLNRWTLSTLLIGALAGCHNPELKVAFAAPVGLTDEPVTSISVMFDREMVSEFETGEDCQTGPLIITPAVAGHFRWDHQDEVVFVPDAALDPHTRYHVEIAHDIVAIDGATVRDGYDWDIEAVAGAELTVDGGIDANPVSDAAE